MSLPRILFRLLLTLCFACLGVSRGRAQNPQNPVPNNDSGFHDHQLYVGDHESINPLTGNLNIQIPLLHLPGRAGHDLDLTMTYNSNIWYFFQYTDPRGIVHSEWIPQGNSPFGGDSFNLGLPAITSQVNPSGLDTCTGNFVVALPDGSKHFFNNGTSGVQINCFVTSTGNQDPAANVPKGEDRDGFVLLDAANSIVTLRDGTKYNFPGGTTTSREDRNGNIINYNGVCGASSCIIDSAGHQVNIHGGPTYPTSITYNDDNGNPQTITFGYTTINISATTSSFPYTPQLYSPGWSVNDGNASMLTSITLPNNTSYTFQYDPTYGELTKITYPTGGYTRYEYGNFPLGTNPVLNEVQPGQPNNARYITAKHVCRSSTGSCASEDTTTYSPSASGNTINNPDGSQIVITVTGGCSNTTTKYLTPGGTLLKTVARTSATNFRCIAPRTPGPPASETITLDNGQQSTTTWTYDTYQEPSGVWAADTNAGIDDPIDVKVTDFSGSLLRETKTTYNTAYRALTPHILDLPTQLQTLNGSGTLVAQTTNGYDESTFPLVNPSSTVVNHDSAYGTSFTQRGNRTSVTRLLLGGTSLIEYFQYDIAGNVLMHKDPAGHVTNFDYTDRFGSNTTCAPPSGQNTYAQLTQTTNALGQHTQQTWFSCSGLMASRADANDIAANRVGTTFTHDGMRRLTSTTRPDGGQTTITYNDTSLPASSTTNVTINSPQSLVTKTVLDGLGRTIQSQLTSDPQGTGYTDTTYDALGRLYTVSNPYRTGSDPTTSSGTTTYYYDGLGRKCLEVPPDGTQPTGGVCPTTQPANTIFTAYSGNTITVTDQTGKARKSVTDALGRLTQVFEDPAGLNYETDYGYDALGNLLCAAQKGTNSGTFTNCTSIPAGWHPRNFSYDSLSRLLTSANPETSTITYKYDSDPNCPTPNSFPALLVSKTDARGIRTCYQYEPLNREVVRNYSNGDPTITTAYDETNCLSLPHCDNIGHRTSMTDGAGSEIWAFDVPDRIHKEQRTTNSITKTATYNLDFAGNITSIVYPTGRTVNYSYDAANRPKTAADGSNGITYATDFQSVPTACLSGAVCYTPQGTFYALSIGQSSTFTGVNLTHIYNNRLQPSEFKASSTGGNAIDITYNFLDSSGHNAGHVYSITNNLDNSRTQNFTYDQVNRIVSAGTFSTTGANCWGYQYTYDAWGNLLSQAGWTPNYNGCSEPTLAPITADGNNHISPFSYDASGNATSDGTYSYSWDAESQLKSAGGVNYSYDGDGRRVYKSNGKLYWYGAGGDILAETNASGNMTAEYIFFGGKRIAMLPAGGNPIYYVEDMLGTSRVLTTNTGVVCYDADFYPYGGERTPYTNNCSATNNYKFEGKERDIETGNDDFGARYYSNRFGRWLSADWSAIPVPVPYANLTNPQTLNLYAMVADDPESFADLDGHQQGTADECRNHGACGGAENESGSQNQTTQTQTGQQQAAQNQAQNQVPPEAKAAIKHAVKASNSPTADDKRGGFHEEGGIYGKDANGNVVVVPAKPGPYSDPTVPGGTAHIDVGNSVNPALKDTLVSVDGTYHVHPGGVVEPSNGKPGGSFVQPPSGQDKSVAYANTNIVVGAGNKRVYFYNSSGVTRETSLKQFLKEP